MEEEEDEDTPMEISEISRSSSTGAPGVNTVSENKTVSEEQNETNSVLKKNTALVSPQGEHVTEKDNSVKQTSKSVDKNVPVVKGPAFPPELRGSNLQEGSTGENNSSEKQKKKNQRPKVCMNMHRFTIAFDLLLYFS